MNFSLFLTELWNARLSLLSGLGDTILISVASVILGSVLGVFVGLAMTYGAKWLRFVVRLYIDFLRGTPVFVLILACFYILSVVGLDLTAFQAGVLALTLFCSSHVGEIVRGALSAIPQGQTEAAKSVGLTFGQTFVYVLLPQALRQILPIPRPRSSRHRRCFRSLAWWSFCLPPSRLSRAPISALSSISLRALSISF